MIKGNTPLKIVENKRLNEYISNLKIELGQANKFINQFNIIQTQKPDNEMIDSPNDKIKSLETEVDKSNTTNNIKLTKCSLADFDSKERNEHNNSDFEMGTNSNDVIYNYNKLLIDDLEAIYFLDKVRCKSTTPCNNPVPRLNFDFDNPQNPQTKQLKVIIYLYNQTERRSLCTKYQRFCLQFEASPKQKTQHFSRLQLRKY